MSEEHKRWFLYLERARPALSGQVLGGERQVKLREPAAVYFLVEDVSHVVFTEAQKIANPGGEDFRFRRSAVLSMKHGPTITLLEDDALRFAELVGFGFDGAAPNTRIPGL